MLNLDASLQAMKFDIAEETTSGTRIKVVGVGGGGGNAAARMMQAGLQGVDFYVLNTDLQALQASPVPNKLAIGSKITSGLGAGSDPAIGRQAALEDTERIIELLEGSDMVFVTAGLGGGTGTGAAPVVAALAKELGVLTVAVVTKPFDFEGARRMRQAEQGLGELAATVDTVITIPNERLLEIAPEEASFLDAFRIADDVLRQAVQGICDIITRPGLINRDFSDVRSIMLGMGHAMMGTASAGGPNAAMEAARKAISCPLLEEGGIEGALGVLINITGSSKLGLRDVNKACSLIREAAVNEEVQVNFGVVLDENAGDEVKITVIATGFHREVPASGPFGLRRDAPPSLWSTPAPDTHLAQPQTMDFTAADTSPAAELQSMPESMHAAMPDPPAMPAVEPERPMAAAPPLPSQRPQDDLDTPAFLRRDRRLFH
jgi:cell division protein FtsZ